MQGYQALMARLRAEALADLDRILASVGGEAAEVQVSALMELLPELGDKVQGAGDAATATFFQELQEMQEVPHPILPDVRDPEGRASWQALVGWASGGRRGESLAQRVASEAFFALLSGGFTKRLTESAADTMLGNAAAQGRMRYQRVPAPGCCSFCGMLASRGAAYRSRESASQVVGRGMSLEEYWARRWAHGKGPGKSEKWRGGQAKGIKPRGSRALGQQFHDNCMCRAVAVRDGESVEMGSQAHVWLDAYREAAGVAKTSVGEGPMSDRIVKEMDRILTPA